MKKPSLSRLKKKLDSLISLYVRKRASDSMGMAKCVSCGRVEPYMSLQCGHYISRSHYATRYDLRNCHPQCVRCNIFLKGAYPEYSNYLLNKFGLDWYKQLLIDGAKIKKWTILELQAEIAKYTELLKKL